MTKPIIVCVPGAWHVPAHFDYVRKELEAADYAVVGVELPGNSEKYLNGRPATQADDISAVRNALIKELEYGDVVLVTHSYSSIIGTAALTDLSTSARSAAGKKTSVEAFVIIAGFLVPAGSTMFALMGNGLAPQYLHEGDHTLPFNGSGAIHVLYNDLEHNEAFKAIHKLKPQFYAINTSPLPDQTAAAKGIPLSYLFCSLDNAVPWETQIATVDGFKAAGIEVLNTLVARTGHSPFLKKPVETAKFIRLAAGEKIETGLEELKEDGSKP